MINLGMLMGVRINRYEIADAEFAAGLERAHGQADRHLQAEMARRAIRLRVEAVYPPGGRYTEEDRATAQRLADHLTTKARQQGIAL